MKEGAGKKGEARAPAESPLGLEPMLGRSMLINQEGLDKVRHALAADSNEWRATAVRPASWRVSEMSATEIPIYLHALFAGLIPPSLPSSMS